MTLKPADVLRNAAKEKLKRGEVVSSMTVRLVTSSEIVAIAKTAGFDSIYVDLEHSSFSAETAACISLNALAAGLPCFVRVPVNAPDHISRVLDSGALGVIVPNVHTEEAARAVVMAAKFAPIGGRGISTGYPHLGFASFPAKETSAAINDATMVIVQCESVEAVANAEAIAAVDGVDMILIGTNDLLDDMGIPGAFDDKRVREAYEQVTAACRKHGKFAGIGGLTSRPQLVADFIKLGARYVSTGTDLGFLLDAAKTRAAQVHQLKG